MSTNGTKCEKHRHLKHYYAYAIRYTKERKCYPELQIEPLMITFVEF